MQADLFVSIHADAAQGGPTWLELPDDLNALDLRLWPRGTFRDEAGVVVVEHDRMRHVATVTRGGAAGVQPSG